jgi:hypothetical protein
VTGQHQDRPTTESPAAGLGRLQDAQRGLRSIQEVLRAAEAGRVDATEVSSVLADYWRTHRPVLQEAGVAVLDVLRLQALEALYRWRAQLDAQLGDKAGAGSAADEPDTT